MKLVAVYGSLLSGLHNHGVMKAAQGELLGVTRLEPKFKLISLGSYPGLIKDEGTTAPIVEVYRVAEENLHILDGLEGYRGENDPSNFYDRITEPTEFGDVYVYTLTPDYAEGRTEVEDGDWRKFHTA